MPSEAPIEDRVTDLETKYVAHDRLIGTVSTELDRQGRLVDKIMRGNDDALRASHHDIEVGVEMKVEQLRMDLSKQIVGQAFLRKENRALFGGIAGMLFVGWVLEKIQLKPETAVAIVSALLGAVALFWNQLQKGERRAKDSIAPPRP